MINNAKVITNKQKTKKAAKICSYEIFEYALAFFLNKVCLLGVLSPFGLSYFAATFPMHSFPFGAIPAFLGILLTGFGVTALKYIGALCVYLIFMMLYNKDITGKIWISAVVASCSLFLSGFIFVFMDGFLMYDMMVLCLETIFCFVSFFAFNKAAVLIRTIKSRKIFEHSDILSIVFLFSVFLLAVMSLPECEPVAQIFAISAILIIASVSEAYTSVAAGVIFGIVLSTSSALPAQVICTFAVSSLCAGFLKKYGRAGAGFGFLAANALMMVYLNSSSITIINILCTLTSILIVLMLPKSFIKKISALVNTPVTTPSAPSCDKEIAAKKIEKTAESCRELSKLFGSIIKNNHDTYKLSRGSIFDNTIDSVCSSCTLCTYCWHKNQAKTAEALSYMFSSMSERGYAIEFDAPADFRSECIRFDDFLEAVNKNYEIHKVNLFWASKIYESKSVVAEQFRNISDVLENMKKQINSGLSRDEMLELKIKAELDKKNISVHSIKAICANGYEIFMTMPPCGDKKICRTLIPAALGSALGFPVRLEERSCSKEQCVLKFCEQVNFSLEVGFAKSSAVASEASGDSHVFVPLPEGKYLLCLSDGMGKGKSAQKQSSLTVSLVKKLLQLGFDKETSLKILNTFLLLKSENETFATVDICIINLVSGALEFIKSGAVNSYVKSGDTVEKIKCSSLPAGAVTSLAADCELLYAKGGDYIVMVSDGITDILENAEENKLKDIISAFGGSTPQELANIIIKSAIAAEKNEHRDDMTVLVSKIYEEM